MTIKPKEFIFNHILLNYYENEYINNISEINPEFFLIVKLKK